MAPRQPSSFPKVLLSFAAGIVVSVVLLEAGLRIVGGAYVFVQERRNRAAAAAGDKGGVTVLCIGDSMTANQYPVFLQSILNERSPGRFTVIDRGMPATNSAFMAARLRENLDACAPSLAVVMGGFMDGDRTFPYGRESLLSRLRVYRLLLLLGEKTGDKRGGKDKIAFTWSDRRPAAAGTGGPAPEARDGRTGPGTDAAGRYLRGIALRDQGRYEEAAATLRKAVEQDGRDVDAWRALAGVYVGLKRFDAAGGTLDEAVKRFPRNALLRLDRGHIHEFNREYDKAERAFRAAVELDGRSEAGWRELGRLYRERGRQDEADGMFRAAAERASRNGPGTSEQEYSCRALALSFLLKGDAAAAERYFVRAESMARERYNPLTRANFNAVADELRRRGIRTIFMQYPVRSVKPLKKLLQGQEGIVFVDNERTFKEALKGGRVKDIFVDLFGGDFGHCTDRGNRMIAENCAAAVLAACRE